MQKVLNRGVGRPTEEVRAETERLLKEAAEALEHEEESDQVKREARIVDSLTYLKTFTIEAKHKFTDKKEITRRTDKFNTISEYVEQAYRY